MTGLSPAARGQKRGALEALRNPPSFLMSMEVNERFPVPAVLTYSLAGTAVSWPAFGALVGPEPTFVTVALLVLASLFSVVFIFSCLGNLGFEENKRDVLTVIRNTAKEAAHGNTEVSLSKSIQEKMQRKDSNYVESLSEKQQRWIARQWNKAFEDAVEARNPAPGIVAGKLDQLIDPERIRRIQESLDALELLQDTSKPLSDIDSFDKQMKALEGRSER